MGTKKHRNNPKGCKANQVVKFDQVTKLREQLIKLAMSESGTEMSFMAEEVCQYPSRRVVRQTMRKTVRFIECELDVTFIVVILKAGDAFKVVKACGTGKRLSREQAIAKNHSGTPKFD